jgi:hypothetical protein
MTTDNIQWTSQGQSGRGDERAQGEVMKTGWVYTDSGIWWHGNGDIEPVNHTEQSEYWRKEALARLKRERENTKRPNRQLSLF